MSLTPADAQALRHALATVVVVPVTPLSADGNPDWGTYAMLTGRLIDGGIKVITPNGNTGEFYALSHAEARQAVETAAKASGGRDPGPNCWSESATTSPPPSRRPGTPRDHGARMIMIHQPVHPYVSAEGWVDYHAAIANAVPDLGVVLYMRNERITGAHIAELADRAPNVIGVKYGVRDATKFAAVARDAGIDRFTWLAGAAELTAPAYWAGGAHGFTSGLANVSPGLALAMLDALRGERLRGRDEGLGVGAPVRGTAPGGLLGRQRERGQGGHGPAGPVPRRRAPAEPPAARAIKEEITGILASWGLT